ncbi:MAG TPA: TauD/TfdA family dioxygenase [Xanthobacteraceae bacterium]|jgi:taurine dioxygenase
METNVAQASPAHAHSESATVVPLSPAIGAEIVGLDLRQPMDDAQFAAVLEAWHRHCVLLFRNQHIETEDQLRFAERFGELSKVINNHSKNSGHPSVMLVSNIRKDGQLIGGLPDGEMYFHSDQCYVERPIKGTTLYAIELPRRGGNTLFANMYSAYETLPADVQRQIADRKAMNVYDYDNNPTARGAVIREGVPHYAHPVVRTHPETGRKALFVNRLMTDHILDMPRAESDRLLGLLFDHQEQRRFVYEHVWSPGDLLLWDNRCSLHARTDFDAGERRLLRRVAIRGEKPF